MSIVHACFQFASNQTTCFELFILVGLQQFMGLPPLMSVCTGNASLYGSRMLYLSHFCLVI